MTDRSAYLIIGAAGGIGSAVSRMLAGRNAGLTLCGRDRGRLDALAAEVGGDAVRVDARNFAELDAAVKRHLDSHGRLSGIVNCAGSILLKPAHLTSEDEFSATIATNLTTAFNAVKAAARPMIAAKGGSIVLVSSAVADRGLVNHEAIAAAKGGVAALALSAAATYARYKIRVNCVAPGLVATSATEQITANPSSLKHSVAMHALGRIGQPDDVAAAIAFLLDEKQSGWTTGQNIGVDGGLSSLMPRS